MKLITAVVLSTLGLTAWAQEIKKETDKLPFTLTNPDLNIRTKAQIQGWGVYSMGREAQIDGNPGLDSVDQRANFYIRRGRLGFSGSPYQNLSYNLTFFYDNTGHDSLSATRGGTLPSTSSGKQNDVTKSGASVGLWDTTLSWKASQSDLFHFTVGYFRPQISRESVTSAFNVTSFEKAASQSYVRQAVIGRGHGRASGINLGGLADAGPVKFDYNLGIFNKVVTGDVYNDGGDTVTLGETQGSESSLVYVGRVAFSFGDPEMKKYTLGHKINYFSKRKGLTLALNGSTQDRSPRYKANHVVGGDFLFNWGHWNVDGEFFYIYQRPNGKENYAKARTGHLRLSRNFHLANGTVLEPTFMVSGYYGETGAQYTGRDSHYDFGVNWYLDETRYKLYAHYVMQDGDGNNLVHKDNSHHFGDYAGIGLTLQF